MTKRILTALSLALIASPALAQHSPTTVIIYGRINGSLEHLSVSDSVGMSTDQEMVRLANNRSVLGFRGSEELANGYKAVWQIEGTLAIDTGVGGIASRDTRVGIAAPWGTVFGGNWTTPYTSSTQALDPFYPTTAGYMSIMGNGSTSTSDNITDTTAFDRRQQNSLHYWTPEWRGFSLRLAHGLSEEKNQITTPSLTSIAGIYDLGQIYLTLAHERHNEYQGPGLVDIGTKVAAAYRHGSYRFGGVVEKLRYQTSTGILERTAFYLSTTYRNGRHGIHFGIARAHDGKGSSTAQVGPLRSGDDTGATHYTLGYDYAMSKRTTLYTYYTHLNNKRNGSYDFALNEIGIEPGASIKGAVFGIRHFF